MQYQNSQKGGDGRIDGAEKPGSLDGHMTLRNRLQGIAKAGTDDCKHK